MAIFGFTFHRKLIYFDKSDNFVIFYCHHFKYPALGIDYRKVK